MRAKEHGQRLSLHPNHSQSTGGSEMSAASTRSTGKYKDMEVPRELVGIIEYMPDVERYREELSSLGQRWDLLTILGQMSGTGMDMTETRQGFEKLTSELLGTLGMETLKKTVQEISSKAQVVVDILIRNLFERTADIGFLATDDDIREFLRTVSGASLPALRDADPDLDFDLEPLDQDEEQPLDQDLADMTPMLAAPHADFAAEMNSTMVERFREYVAKYTVYFNIILLDAQGKVRVQLDQTNQVSLSQDPIIAEALATNAEYVEMFRATDLLPGQGESLIYAYRVTETNDASSSPLGVLCLCFRFDNEMQGIFNNLIGPDDWTVLTILDRDGRVLSSSDANHIPVGSRMELALDREFKVVRFGGRKYLAKTCATKGYQGYMGQGWYGHAMLPLEYAFSKDDNQDGDEFDHSVLQAVMGNHTLFSSELRRIPQDADHIQRELDRTVWNGNVRQDAQGKNGSASKVLLWEISKTGGRTKSVFEESIGNLHETVISSILSDVKFLAALAIDIMDRNLYERANDCRWWALTSAFRRILDQGQVSSEDVTRISDILAYINGLYTVYTNLFVYNTNGTILAVSNQSESHLTGRTLTDDWVRRTLEIRDSQKYSVSAFSSTPLYGNRPTYIYGAAITSLDHQGGIVGGIGIVFDSEPQFEAMLLDSLPRTPSGEVLEGCFGALTDRQRRIISTTDHHLEPGQTLELEEEFFSQPNGEGVSRIVRYRDHFYAVGARTSGGYREYKSRSDDYQNDVVALVFVPLGKVATTEMTQISSRGIGMQVVNRQAVGRQCRDVATFFIGDKWLGIYADRVHQAIPPEGLTAIPDSSPCMAGKILYNDHILPVISLREEYRLPDRQLDADTQIIVCRGEKLDIGLLVDRLGEIPEIALDRVDEAKSVLDREDTYIEALIKPEAGAAGDGELLLILNPDRLLKYVTNRRRIPASKEASPPKH